MFINMTTFGGNDSIFLNICTQEIFLSFTFVISLILYHILSEFPTYSKKSVDNLAFQAK